MAFYVKREELNIMHMLPQAGCVLSNNFHVVAKLLFHLVLFTAKLHQNIVKEEKFRLEHLLVVIFSFSDLKIL